jgi:Fic family protein
LKTGKNRLAQRRNGPKISRYYDLLQKVRTEGAWEEWIEFFLEGAESTARQAADTAVELVRLVAEDQQRIQSLGRPALSALRVHEYMRKRPLMNIGAAADALGLSIPTVAGAVKNLSELGIVRETTGRQRGRVFAYERFLQLVTAGMEPLR